MKIPVIVIFIALFVAACANNSATDQFIGFPAAPAGTPLLTISHNPVVRAYAYVSTQGRGQAIAQVQGKTPQRLSGINLALYSAYQPVFFRLLDRDGINELAILQSTDFSGVRLCYDVFHYNPSASRFTRKPSDYFCTPDND